MKKKAAGNTGGSNDAVRWTGCLRGLRYRNGTTSPNMQESGIARQREQQTAAQNRAAVVVRYSRIYLQNRISIAATCARVALPWGLSVLSLVPVTMPAPQAHCMAGIAYSLKSAKSA